jgi:hypothetical protein
VFQQEVRVKKKSNRPLVSIFLLISLCSAALALIATLPGGGWWFGAQVQNVSTCMAVVTFTTYDYATAIYRRSDNIGQGASMNYSPTSFALPGNFQGSSIASSTKDIRAIVNLTNRSITGYGDPNSNSPAAGQYQGMISTGTRLRFPLVKNEQGSPNAPRANQEKTTTIIIQNVGTAQTTVYATFLFPNLPDPNFYYNTSINPGRIAIFDPINARNNSNQHPPTGDTTDALGSLTVTASQNLAGIALEHYTLEDHATVLQATRGLIDDDRDTTLYAPINKNYRYNRFTGLTVQNAGSGSITITVIYYFDQDPHCLQSGQVTVTTPNVASGVSVTFPSSAFPTGCFASAKITASNGGGSDPNKIVAIINESFTGAYLATNPNHAQEMTSYNAIPGKFASKTLSVPLFKENSYSKGTGLTIQNVGGSTAHVTATFKNNSQSFVTYPMNIDPNKAIVLQDMRLKPASFWNGTPMTPSALGCAEGTYNGCGANGVFSVIVASSDQNIVAIANESTYPFETPLISQDKSNYEAFNLPTPTP